MRHGNSSANVISSDVTVRQGKCVQRVKHRGTPQEIGDVGGREGVKRGAAEGKGEAGFLMSREPDVGLHPRTLGS